MESSDYIKPVVPSTESIDLGKLLMILRTSWIWIVLIFIVVNSVAYLFIRYTKNVYRSDSEIKLDVKKDATDFGIRQMVDNADVDIISGEIELIQSKLFLNHVLDRSAFEISFVSVGRVLNDELYRNLPVDITVHTNIHSFYDTRIEYAELDDNMYRLRVPDRGIEVNGSFGRRVLVGDLEMTLRKNHEFIKGDEVGYHFTINSRDVLLDYLRTNLIAEPLNYNANTIRVAFKDHNPFKAQAVLNKIDTIYLQYSYEQKNLANKQKIDWLSNELRQIESRMEAYEDYFENFTIKNKTNDLDLELTRTITSLNRIDSQRYEYTRRVREIDRLLVSMEEGNYTPPVWLRNALPVEVGENIEKLSELKLELDRLKLSYNEITFTFRQKQQAFESLKQRANAQLTDVRTRWTKQLEELVARKVELEKQFAAFPDKNTEFTKNQRFYKLYEEFYLTLMQSKSEFEIAQAGTTPDFKILSPASFSSRPISPNRIMIAGIGITLSLVFNFLFIAILYLLNNKITNLSELEKIKSAPVLGAIPVSRYSQDNGLHVLNYPRSMVSEAIRSLRTNLDFFQIRSKEKVIAVSSTVSGEGKSFVAMNLGAALALSRK
ncbi:MAG TPA: Wzz/FepE/Etk N-terminal domain-containing protein, partial [Chryseosolibacter sp.]|nr:Wzz/FepE/Etk N-terminal domain-containing protein [Chryseosolibacter sp.]